MSSQRGRTVVEPVEVGHLVSQAPLPFELYTKTRERAFTLYKRTNETILASEKASLRSQGVDKLYINTQKRPLLDRYLSSNARLFLAQQDATLDEKSGYLYSSASRAMRGFFDREGKEAEQVMMAVEIAEATMELIAGEPDAFYALVSVSSHDYYTFSHSVDVMIYSVGLGRRVGLGEESLKKLAAGALMHDVGKSRVPLEIVNKKGPLEPVEFDKMRSHPLFGAQLLSEIEQEDMDILSVVLYHHERYAGGGYPSGLKGDEIPLFARIVTIADVFAALSTKRSYKEAFGSFQALEVMKNQMPEHFDKRLLMEFIRLMGSVNTAQ